MALNGEIMRGDIEQLIDKLLLAKSRDVIANVNASRCGTRTDHEEAKSAESDLYDAYNNTVDALVNLVTQGMNIVRPS